jgi:hypothetical protein
MGRSDFCDSALSQGIERFPNDAVLCLFGGWSFLHLHRAEEATKAFQKAENLLGEEKSSADLLAGEAAASWASGANENAVGACLRLINIDKRCADLREIAQINLPEEEKRPLLEALGETLRRHRELEP